ncbi:hypothetical protein KDA11_02685, partial [Candidatus Saccharibacteria bacterium]|nr:hypothetical protein [Candidatus Saccharibacteria bacterium]
LQGLGLKVDLVGEGKAIDAEDVLADSIKDEAEHLSTVDVPAPEVSDVDVTDDAVSDEFSILELDDNISDDIDSLSQNEETVLVTDNDNQKEAN